MIHREIFSALKMKTQIVFETLVFSLFNHLRWLVVREYFIVHCGRESYRSYFNLYSRETVIINILA
jgi:hypothetical protein